MGSGQYEARCGSSIREGGPLQPGSTGRHRGATPVSAAWWRWNCSARPWRPISSSRA